MLAVLIMNIESAVSRQLISFARGENSSIRRLILGLKASKAEAYPAAGEFTISNFLARALI